MNSLLHHVITGAFVGIVLIVYFRLRGFRQRGEHSTVTAHAPEILASLGILGTFVGIVLGLLNFDPTQLDESVEGLLGGLRTAFISSIAGILASLLFRGVMARNPGATTAEEVGPEDVLSVLRDQLELLRETRNAIAGNEESSLAGQLKLLRTDLLDRRREDNELRRQFEAELWERLQSFAEMMSKSATEQVIEALKKVIVDFNQNLTEQFGDNFKKLDSSVQKLVEWQEGYKSQLEQLHVLYSQSVKQIQAIEASVLVIAERCQRIPDSMDDLSQILETANYQIEELERHLDAFAKLRDRAIEAVPQTTVHVEKMTQDIAASVGVAAERLAALQDTSRAQIAQSHRVVRELATSGQQVRSDIQSVQERVTNSMTKMEAQILEQMRRTVAKTGEGMTKQIEALDEKMAEQVQRTMQYMGNALGQISGKFVEDYRKLVRQMEQVVQRGNHRP